MRGASRASYAGLRERLCRGRGRRDSADRVGDELFAVVRLLDSEHGLRRALADPTKPPEEKAAVAGRLLHGKVSAETEELVADGRGGPLGELQRPGRRARAARHRGAHGVRAVRGIR